MFALHCFAQRPKSAQTILKELDDLYRGDASTSTMRLEIKTEDWRRTLRLKSWTRGEEMSLIRVLEPEKERGITTLKVENDLYNYLPAVDRKIKIPTTMMSASWMGSHISNDDLVKESRFSEDYRCNFTPTEPPRDNQRVIDCIPNENAPVVWSRVRITLLPTEDLPQVIEFFDERGSMERVIRYQDYRRFSGRRLPARIEVYPTSKPNEKTVMTIENITFLTTLPDEVFTLEPISG